MSQENVEIARRAFEAAGRQPKPDFDTVNALFHPDHELVSLVSFRRGELQGAEGFRDFLTSMDEAYGSWEMEIEEARALDEERVLLVMRVRAEGKRSGVPVEQQIAIVMTIREGRVVRSETYPSAAEALEAAGLSE